MADNDTSDDGRLNIQLPTQEEIDQAMQALNATAGKIVAALNQLIEAANAIHAAFNQLSFSIPTGGDDE